MPAAFLLSIAGAMNSLFCLSPRLLVWMHITMLDQQRGLGGGGLNVIFPAKLGICLIFQVSSLPFFLFFLEGRGDHAGMYGHLYIQFGNQKIMTQLP